ncbi:MAG: MarR family winged helix-turn-helix transcriptional regulator [Sporichthyaceae bacterium]|nr:MarR family winged helix-turn-helix transcriptional regulator [Sporichthyaceae bacterium]
MAERGSGYSLLFDLFVANGHVRTLLTRALAGAPLRADEYAVYSVLFENGPTSPTELARILGLPPTTISDHARAMVARKHARRRRNQQDQRAHELELTPAGLAAHRATSTQFGRAMRAIEARLQRDPDLVRDSLQALGDAARRANAEPARDPVTGS